MNKMLYEVCRCGNFIWYSRPFFDEYELQHVGIGTVMTVDRSDLGSEDGDDDVEKLWNLTSRILFEHFANVDGAGQRALVRRAFSLE